MSEIRAHAVSATEVPLYAQQLLAQPKHAASQPEGGSGSSGSSSGQAHKQAGGAFAALRLSGQDGRSSSSSSDDDDDAATATDSPSTSTAETDKGGAAGAAAAAAAAGAAAVGKSDAADGSAEKKKKKKKRSRGKKAAAAAAAAAGGAGPAAEGAQGTGSAQAAQSAQGKAEKSSGTLEALLASLVHPTELYSLLEFKFGGGEKKLFPKLDLSNESADMQRCFYFLNMTSRSFAPVIKALHPKLRPAICIFYLVLRGLDTVEDDMTINPQKKKKLLEKFHTNLFDPTWTFNESGPNEKDRQLLVEFSVVTSEFNKLEPHLAGVIRDICKRMGAGMSQFVDKSVVTVDDYNLYCHYVAGLVGIGLAQLFSNCGLEAPEVGRDHDLANSMGLFLQKTNIIRDYREDLEDGRTWYPKTIWSQYAKDLADFTKPENEKQGLKCLNHMVADALGHVPDVFKFMGRIKDQSIFNFCAIPQVMAIATLALCYNNRNVFKTNVKIRKGTAVQLMLRAQNMDNLYDIFAEFIVELKAKMVPGDKRLAEKVEKIERLLLKLRPQTAAILAANGSGISPLVATTAAVVVAAGAAYFFGVHRRGINLLK